jgi:tellurite resistance protein TerC
VTALALANRGARNINSPALWGAFLAGVLVLLAVDLWFASRRSSAQTFRSALLWSLFWIALSLAFGGYIWTRFGGEQGLEFFAGYMLEKSLSIDNLFVFVLLFRSFAIPPAQQHRVLFWGVLGALILRGTLILIGVELVHHFHFVVMIFGAVLIVTALRLAFGRDGGPAQAPTDSLIVRFVRARVPMTAHIEGPHFFVREAGRLLATPLLLAVVAAESADLVFALDSIPAVFAVTDDSFLVFSSNVCALLGLRALYFVVAGALTRVRYLKAGLSAILLFVGTKMIVDRWMQVPTGTSLAVIAAILIVALIASWAKKPAPASASEP